MKNKLKLFKSLPSFEDECKYWLAHALAFLIGIAMVLGFLILNEKF